ncbi:ISKra4 family transposase, partial [Candidatus Frankia alpina]
MSASEDERAAVLAAARTAYSSLEAPTVGEALAGASLDALEDPVNTKSRAMLRLLVHVGLDVVSARETQAATAPVGAGGLARTRAEKEHQRSLVSRFGPVTVSRLANRSAAPGAPNVHLLDADWNLPAGVHAQPLLREITHEATRGSFDDAVAAVEHATGQKVGKRQAVELARTAVDVEAFYETFAMAPAGRTLVIQCEGKGSVMRPDGLRPATRKAATEKKNRLDTRLLPGGKSNRKRMAELTVVHDATVVPSSVDDIIPSRRLLKAQAAGVAPAAADGPTAKWMTASVDDGIPAVIGAALDEAERRDPHHQRTWVVLVDSNNTYLDGIRVQAA